MSDLSLRDFLGDDEIAEELREQTERASRVSHELHRLRAAAIDYLEADGSEDRYEAPCFARVCASTARSADR